MGAALLTIHVIHAVLDNDNFVAPVVSNPPNKWADEDVSDGELKESWDAEEEEEEEVKVVKKVAEKPVTKIKASNKGGKSKGSLGTSKGLSDAADEADPLEEKRRRQQLVEAADFENALDLVGEMGLQGNTESGATTAIPPLNNPADFDAFAEHLIQSLEQYDDNAYMVSFLKKILLGLTKKMGSAELNQLELLVGTLSADAMKSEKAAKAAAAAAAPGGGKKKKKKAPAVRNVLEEDFGHDQFEQYEAEYDAFM